MTVESDPYFVEDLETYMYIRFVAEMSTSVPLSARQIERESEKDPELHNILECIRSGRWDRIKNKAYLPSKTELCYIGKLLMRGTRTVIPKSLRDQVLYLAHEGHPGIVAMKRRLRSKVWWPGMDQDVENFVQTC